MGSELPEWWLASTFNFFNVDWDAERISQNEKYINNSSKKSEVGLQDQESTRSGVGQFVDSQLAKDQLSAGQCNNSI